MDSDQGYSFQAADFEESLNLEYFDLTGKREPVYNPRYVKPPLDKEIPEECLLYADAAALARAVNVTPGSRTYCIVSGSFYFGDFIEAWMVENNIRAKEMTISTLSMNENNVDSLANLLNGGFVDRLNLIVSAYFFSHYRKTLVPYIYEELDREDRFQFAVAGSHCKICMLETYSGHHIIMHGSANLRSSSNIEQFMIEEGKVLYDFNHEIQLEIVKKYATINHEVRGGELWQAVQRTGQAKVEAEAGAKVVPESVLRK